MAPLTAPKGSSITDNSSVNQSLYDQHHNLSATSQASTLNDLGDILAFDAADLQALTASNPRRYRSPTITPRLQKEFTKFLGQYDLTKEKDFKIPLIRRTSFRSRYRASI